MTKVHFEVGGETYPIKEELKARGYRWNGSVWMKTLTLKEAKKEVEDLVLKKIIDPDLHYVFLTEISPEDDREVYFFDKKYVKPVWTNPSSFTYSKLKKLGYSDYPGLNWRDYFFKGREVFVKEDNPTDREKIRKYRKEHPELKLPELKE